MHVHILPCYLLYVFGCVHLYVHICKDAYVVNGYWHMYMVSYMCTCVRLYLCGLCVLMRACMDLFAHGTGIYIKLKICTAVCIYIY